MFNTDYDIKVYSKEELVSEIYIRGSSVTFKNYNYPAVRTSATVDDLEEFFEDRCFPREQANCKDLLRRLGLDCYEPELLCRKTHGLQFDDFIWLQFSDELQVR